MRVRFWGTRGSIAKPGPATARYGGNTSCVEVRTASGGLIVIDCGTGAHDLGQALIAENPGGTDGYILISHTHWDHIQGMPFFAPLFQAGGTWTICGPNGLSGSIREALAGQMQHTYFPIGLEQFTADVRYRDLVEGTFHIGDIEVTTRYLNHPALTLAYRIHADGASVVYCCDHEPHATALASGVGEIAGPDRRYVEFIAGADLVIHDAQYTAADFPDKRGWGHSSAEYAVRVCEEAGVRCLAITHYDPLRTDAAVDAILADLQSGIRRSGSALMVVAAAEGMTLPVSPRPGRDARPPRNHASALADIDVGVTRRPVLLCVPDAAAGAQLARVVAQERLAAVVTGGAGELADALRHTQAALVILSHQPPLIDGLAIARQIHCGEADSAGKVPIVLVVAGEHLADRRSDVAAEWLVMPFSDSYARARIRALVLRVACRWVPAALPADEQSRLGALQDLAILDSEPEAEFDRITRIAASAFGVPIALVSLIDRDRQWFKSCFGLDVRETSRDQAFCAHVVHLRTDLVVPDTYEDPRFADNPLVREAPRIRFYAGAPLIVADGSCIGTLCLIDTRPRQLGRAEIDLLHDLRDLVLAVLSARPIG